MGSPARAGGRARGENIVPMINIVFLLLIFFMLSATIAPPDPFGLELPEGAAGAAEGAPRTHVLWIGPAGELAHAGAEGAAALAALADAHAPGDRVVLRADAALDGAVFAGVLADLAGLGIAEITLAVRR
jgi:biopolymer transport protein ExbD